MTALLLSAVEGGVLRLTLADGATRNSLSEAMMAALREALDRAAGDKAVRVIVLAGEGPAFSAGHNLKDITAHRAGPDKGAAYFAELFEACAQLMLGIVHHPKPVIAEVAGIASAAGCQLVASCDLAVAAETARFCTPGVNIGLFCSTPMVALSRNMSAKHAMEMLLTGDVFGAEDALRFGLVNRVTPAHALTGTVMALANRIASKSMVTVKTGKQAFHRQRDLPLAEAYAYTARVMTENLLMRDAEEGIAAFIAKRPPEWTDEP
ncbi:enoyl-CoA hydratase [Aestuariivirga sp.]|uniref:enoyl-CoA hydratase n=1 Tax=Aestuariivirga sp. TaxID=2650926 RepID=UPI0025BE5C5F|nr:enoyl-CoA hydratase [Aestuariivirga sp.]MCA3555265.1 enoyl-CoA hydratase [Aestuariivirga sp.]